MEDLIRRTEMLQALDRVCDQFEYDFRAGHAPRIEDILTATEPELRTHWRRCLLEIELELRHQRGDTLPLIEYLTRFPDAPETIYSAFAAVCRESLEFPSERGNLP